MIGMALRPPPSRSTPCEVLEGTLEQVPGGPTPGEHPFLRLQVVSAILTQGEPIRVLVCNGRKEQLCP